MRTLLIGGHGFIGRHLVEVLSNRGGTVVVSDKGEDFVPLIGNVDAIVHLACETTPSVSARQPTRESDNIQLGLRLAETLLEYPDVHLVFASSGGTVYGDQPNSPIAEDARLAPVSFHGAGKASLELFFGVLRNAGRKVINVRPANAYGPFQPLRAGFGFVRTLLEHARTGEELVIWGDGEAVRDFVYVADVVQAIALLLQHGASGSFNVGSGIGYSLNQVLNCTRKVTGREIPVRYEPTRCGDVRRSVLDVSALENICGWKPQTGLEEGVRKTWVSLLSENGQ